MDEQRTYKIVLNCRDPSSGCAVWVVQGRNRSANPRDALGREAGIETIPYSMSITFI